MRWLLVYDDYFTSAKLDHTMEEIIGIQLVFRPAELFTSEPKCEKSAHVSCSHTRDFLQVFDINNHLTVTLKQTMVCS